MEKNLSSLYAPHQVAEIFGVSIRAVFNWVNNKKIPNKKIWGLLRFDPDEISTWMDSQDTQLQEELLPKSSFHRMKKWT